MLIQFPSLFFLFFLLCFPAIYTNYVEGVNNNVQFNFFTATDPCGNIATESQVVFVRDIELPVLQDVPPDTTHECGSPLEPPVVTVIDNCDADTTATATCDENVPAVGKTTCCWEATDQAGNHARKCQVIDTNPHTYHYSHTFLPQAC